MANWWSFDIEPLYPALLAYAAEVGKKPGTTTAWTGYVVATAGLNMRAGRSVADRIITTLAYGTEVTVHAKIGDWYEISYDGTPGYVFAEFISRKLPVITSGPDDPNFEKAIEFVLRWEGGYVNDPNDPGGETKYGISKRSYPNLDIRNLTIEQAKELYFKDYWQKSGADKLDWPMCLAVLDFAVNAGFGRAQQALSSTGDDFIKYMAWRIDWYTRIDGWGRYGAAWIRRCAALMNEVRK